MSSRAIWAWAAVVMVIGLLVTMRGSVGGQDHATGKLDLPGLGPIDLDKLPAELRDNIRIPGVVYEEPDNTGGACLSDASCPGGTCGPPTVSCPPAAPIGAQSAAIPTVATDAAGTAVVGWQGNVNTPGTSVYDTFARSFNGTLISLKNDFRVDLSGPSFAEIPQVARARLACVGGTNQNRTCQSDSECPGSVCRSSASFPFVWADNRRGHFDIYTRVVPSLQ